MADESRECFMNVEFAIQRELACRRKIFLLQSQEDDDFEKEIEPSELLPLRPSVSPSRSSIASLPSIPDGFSVGKQQASTSSAEHLLPQLTPLSISHPVNANQAEISFCTICNIPCSGSCNYKPSIDGRKHKAKEQELRLGENDVAPSPSRSPIASLPSSPSGCSGLKQASTSSTEFLLPQQAQSSISHPVNANQAEIIFCTICNVPCCGSRNYKQHIGGRKHKAKEQELKLGRNDAVASTSMSPIASLPSSPSGCSGVMQQASTCSAEHQLPLQPQSSITHPMNANEGEIIFCTICDVPCFGSYNYKQHMDHKHNAREHELRFGRNDVGQDNKEANKRRWCEVCSTGCTGEELFQLHSRGKKNKIELEKSKHARNGSKEMRKERKWCKLCDVSCPNEDAFRMHLEGKKHVTRLIGVGKKKRALEK